MLMHSQQRRHFINKPSYKQATVEKEKRLYKHKTTTSAAKAS